MFMRSPSASLIFRTDMICAGGRKTKKGCKGRRDSRATECKKKEKCESRPVAINYSSLEHALAPGLNLCLSSTSQLLTQEFCPHRRQVLSLRLVHIYDSNEVIANITRKNERRLLSLAVAEASFSIPLPNKQQSNVLRPSHKLDYFTSDVRSCS